MYSMYSITTELNYKKQNTIYIIRKQTFYLKK